MIDDRPSTTTENNELQKIRRFFIISSALWLQKATRSGQNAIIFNLLFHWAICSPEMHH